MAVLTRESILGAEDDLSYVPASVPEWGGEVLVKVMSSAERDAFEVTLPRDKQGHPLNVRASLVVACAVDDQGNKLFEPVDAVALGRKSAGPVDRVFAVAKRINDMTDADVEELEGN